MRIGPLATKTHRRQGYRRVCDPPIYLEHDFQKSLLLFRTMSVSPLANESSARVLEKLQLGAGLVAFDRALSSTARTVGFYSFVFLLFGITFVATGRNGWIGLGLGCLLLAESIYLARVRSSRAILIAGLTLAAFSAWLFLDVAIGWLKKDPTMVRGVIGAFFLGIGAWNLLKSYRSYELLLAQSDPEVNRQVRELLERIGKCKASETPDIIEWRLRGVGESGFWRMKPDGDLMLLAKFKDKTFGFGGPVERAIWISRKDIRVQREGEKWMGKKLNASLLLPFEELKISIDPVMLARLESQVMGIPVSS